MCIHGQLAAPQIVCPVIHRRAANGHRRCIQHDHFPVTGKPLVDPRDQLQSERRIRAQQVYRDLAVIPRNGVLTVSGGIKLQVLKTAVEYRSVQSCQCRAQYCQARSP